MQGLNDLEDSARCGRAAFESTPLTSTKKRKTGGEGVGFLGDKGKESPSPATQLSSWHVPQALPPRERTLGKLKVKQVLPLLDREKSFLCLYKCDCKMLVGLGLFDLQVFVLELMTLCALQSERDSMCDKRGRLRFCAGWSLRHLVSHP